MSSHVRGYANSLVQNTMEDVLRVLLVEDEALVALYAQDVLEGAGHVVCGITARGDMVLATAEQTAPQVVLVDLRLADGETGARAAQEVSERLKIRVVYVTGTPDLLDGVKMVGKVIRKPYSPQQLLDAVGPP
jgi:CheY-like chemotaxis protein